MIIKVIHPKPDFMTIIKQIRRIERLDSLIRSGATGTPAELAKKLGMSRSQTYSFLREIKEELDAPIYYSRSMQSYCYGKKVKFIFGFRPERN